jgi:hypothetical protein
VGTGNKVVWQEIGTSNQISCRFPAQVGVSLEGKLSSPAAWVTPRIPAKRALGREGPLGLESRVFFPPFPSSCPWEPRGARWGHSHVPRAVPSQGGLLQSRRTLATAPDKARAEASLSWGRRVPEASQLRHSIVQPPHPESLRTLAARRGLASHLLHWAPPARGAPHLPVPRGRRAAPSSRAPSSATVTLQLRPAMAIGRLGLGVGKATVAGGSEQRLWAPSRAPGELHSAPARSPARRRQPGPALRSWRALTWRLLPPCPPPLPA